MTPGLKRKNLAVEPAPAFLVLNSNGLCKLKLLAVGPVTLDKGRFSSRPRSKQKETLSRSKEMDIETPFELGFANGLSNLAESDH